MTARADSEMSVLVWVCGNVFDGLSDTLTGRPKTSSKATGLRRSSGRCGDRPEHA
jgi:hypothetical protein